MDVPPNADNPHDVEEPPNLEGLLARLQVFAFLAFLSVCDEKKHYASRFTQSFHIHMGGGPQK